MATRGSARGGLFRGPDGRPWPVIRVGLYLIAYAFANLVLGGTLTILIGAVAPAALATLAFNLLTPLGLIVVAASTAATVLATWAFCRLVDRIPLTRLGLHRDAGWLRDLLGGMLVGAVLMTGIVLVEIGLGAYRVEGVGVTGRAVASVLMGLVLYALVAFGEELLARGYVLRTLAEQWDWRGASVASALIFALLHAGNPGSDVWAVLGVFFAGVMLAVGYVRTRRLWLPIGVHWTWNLFQGPVYGFPVSGTEAAGLLALTPIGPDVLTGGPFGPEASAVGVVACIVGAAILARWPVDRRAEPDVSDVASTAPARRPGDRGHGLRPSPASPFRQARVPEPDDAAYEGPGDREGQ